MPRPKSNKESERLRSMIHAHLRRNSALAPSLAPGAHLDEDMLTAFTEGRLGENESAPVIKHLVGCSSCRRITAQLIRLDTELAGDERHVPVTPEEPNRIRRLLSDLAARVLPSSDTEVFAYHAPADDFEKKDEAKNNGEKE
ncbi:MAG TPA: zf-HC2 domain-containing protein [Pyrinomonadaceae bacterium]|nr:zf-HC2 domain-containing protein [Pyrinomonadaceae bacterium]